jgi:type III secretion protein HrpB1
MIPKFERKAFVSGLVSVLSEAVSRDQLDDAEALMVCVRVLRPRMAQLDLLEALIAAKRGRWGRATQLLDDLDATMPNWEPARPLRIWCMWAVGHADWRSAAEKFQQTSTDADALYFMDYLLNLSSPARSEPVAVNDESPEQRRLTQETRYLRA